MTETQTSRDAGSLYDQVSGQCRWAWVDGDEIKSVGYHATDPNEMEEQKALGRRWLQVRHFDAAPFNLTQHWREKPVITIAGDYVRCTYPITSQERA